MSKGEKTFAMILSIVAGILCWFGSESAWEAIGNAVMLVVYFGGLFMILYILENHPS